MPNSNSKLVQPNARAEQERSATVKEINAKLAMVGADTQQEIMRMIEAQVRQANQANLREFDDNTEEIKEAYAHKERVNAKNFKKLQEAKRVRAELIAKAEEDYTAVIAEIRKSVETEEAFIAELEGKNEELRHELCARMDRGYPEDFVNRIMVPGIPKAGQKPVANPTWASKVAGMATATEEGTAMETNAPMSAQELRELEEAIRPK
ncbi:hypothetical protein FBU31_006834 [Coemansia sp. 'formosensis']|nr:hypothetical protein FBU31_006834 [Coemansia sp. 'formosensis']